MSYEPTIWKKGDKVTSTKLNKIENGIQGNDEEITSIKEDLQQISTPVINDVSFTGISRKYLTSTGVGDIAADSYYVSSAIEVAEGDEYIITCSANWANYIYAWFDSNDVIISGVGTGGSGSTIVEKTLTVVVPNGAKYLRIAYISPKVGYVKFEDGVKNNLLDRVVTLEKLLPVSAGTVTLNKDGNAINIIDDTTSMSLSANMASSDNGAFNMIGYYKSDGTLYKSAADDIAPIVYDGSYRCGNHGNNVVIEVTASGHGLTESDIGKVVISANSTEYVIVKIVDSSKFWMIQNSNSQTFDRTLPTSPITGTNISIAFSSSTVAQLKPCINNLYQKIYVDGTEITSNGSYNGEYITIVEGYYSIDTLAMLTTLKSNVGSNTNTSYYADTLSQDLLYENAYTVSGGLMMYVASTIKTIRDGISFGTWGAVQSQALNGTTSFQSYVADSTDTDITLQSGEISSIPATWANADFPPYKFFQFSNTDTTRGFALVYDLTVDKCVPTTRKGNISSAFNCGASTHKMYPYLYTGLRSLPGGTELKAGAIRTPISKNKPIVIAYSAGDKTIIEIDTFSTGMNFVTIPNYKGKSINVIHVSGGVSVVDHAIYGNQIRIYGKGSVCIELL